MNHWVLTRDTAQLITTQLDLNRITLSYAKRYYSAYGVNVKGRSKADFIKNLWQLVKSNEQNA